MDATTVEFSGNDCSVFKEVVISLLLMLLQFIPVLVIYVLIYFCDKGSKADLYGNMVITIAIDSATAITTIYYKNYFKNLVFVFLNLVFFAVALLFYIVLMGGQVINNQGLFYVFIAIGTIIYCVYKIISIIIIRG